MHQDVPSLAASGAVRRGEAFASRLFGYDIFVSFALGTPPRSSQAYASDLARRLRDRDLSVFFSEETAPPGTPLNATLARALERSQLLVVLVNRGTLDRPGWVQTEVETFRKRRPGRPIIPIDLDGCLRAPGLPEAANLWLGHQGNIWLEENPASASDGLATEELVKRLLTAPRHLRVNRLWRGLVGVVVGGLAVLSVGLWFAMQASRESERRARDELHRSVANSLVAQSRVHLSDSSQHDDVRGMLEVVAAARLARDGVPDRVVLDGLWNALSAKKEFVRAIPIEVSQGHPDDDPVGDIAWSPDGSYWVLTEGKALRIRRVSDGAIVGEPLAIGDSVWRRVAFSPDGSVIAAATLAGKLRLLDPKSRRNSSPLKGESQFGRVVDFGWSPKGDELWVASEETSRVWVELVLSPGDPLQATVVRRQSLPDAAGAVGIRSLAVDPTGRWLAFGTGFGREMAGKRVGELYVVPQNAGSPSAWSGAFDWEDVGAIVFRPDGSLLAAAGGGRYYEGVREPMRSQVALWAPDAKRIGLPRAGHTAQVRTLRAAADASRFWSGSFDGTVRVWGGSDAVPEPPVLRGHKGRVLSIALSPDGRRLVSISDDRTLRIWQVQGAQPLQMTAVTAPGATIDPALLPGDRVSPAVRGDMVAKPSAGGKLTLEVAGRPRRTRDTGPLVAVALLHDGAEVAAVTSAGRFIRFQTTDGQAIGDGIALRSLPAKFASPFLGWKTTISSSGKSVVALSAGVTASGGFVVWDAGDGRVKPSPTASDKFVRSLALDDMSGLLLKSSVTLSSIEPDREYIEFLDAQDLAPTGWRLDGVVAYMMEFASDGLAVNLWDAKGRASQIAAPRAWPDALCAKLSRNMSKAEWRAWVSPEIEYRVQCAGLPIPAD